MISAMRSDHPFPRMMRLALRAVIDLAIARRQLASILPQGVLTHNRAVARLALPLLAPGEQARRCNEAAFFVSRMALRVPWRSDCLVQALAGQRWLARQGIASEIVVGAATNGDGSLNAHAWLRHGERIVLGGDIARFQPLLDLDVTLLEQD